MLRSCSHRIAALALLAVGCLLNGTASGQPAFDTGSLLAPPVVEEPLISAEPALPAWSAPDCYPACCGLEWGIAGQGRGYYLNDQRIEFTGVEETFAVEGVLDAGFVERTDGWELIGQTQIFLNQPFDPNILVDTPERRSFANNFQLDPLELSQLYAAARYGDALIALGRFVTPFGRFYFPNYRNRFDDSPFIRSEAIRFRETGLLLQWDPGIWVLNAALTNGGFYQDANSSKALVSRVGIDQPHYALGASVKWQDGNGSESQKVYSNHAGVDAMVRRGPWTLSTEAIYDQYGLRRPGTNLNDITWGRSLYYRDMNNGYHVPITGFGYYVNLGYESPNWTIMLNYGEFYPEHIGRPKHDVTTRRGLLKASRHWTPHFETYSVLLLENNLSDAFDNSTRHGFMLILGSQFAW